jgi:uncharacterized protein (TIGR02246 family)
MKKILFVSCFIINGCLAYAQNVTSNEKTIRSLLQQMEGAWNKNDMLTYCKSLMEDGTWINVVGMFWRDKKETVKAHLAFGETMFKYSLVSHDLIEFRDITPDVVIAYVKWNYLTTQDFYLPDGVTRAGKKGDTDHSLMELIFVKKDNQWLITSVTNTRIDPNAATYDPIKRN